MISLILNIRNLHQVHITQDCIRITEYVAERSVSRPVRPAKLYYRGVKKLKKTSFLDIEKLDNIQYFSKLCIKRIVPLWYKRQIKQSVLFYGLFRIC
jgi:hypothetical protein